MTSRFYGPGYSGEACAEGERLLLGLRAAQGAFGGGGAAGVRLCVDVIVISVPHCIIYMQNK